MAFTTLEYTLAVLTSIFGTATVLLVIYLILTKCCRRVIRWPGHDTPETGELQPVPSIAGHLNEGHVHDVEQATANNSNAHNEEQAGLSDPNTLEELSPVKRGLPVYTTRYNRRTLDVYSPYEDLPASRLSIFAAAQHYYENLPQVPTNTERSNILSIVADIEEDIIVPDIQEVSVGLLGETAPAQAINIYPNPNITTRAKSFFNVVENPGETSNKTPEVDVKHGMFISKKIGPEGGKITLHGIITLEIPKAALTDSQKISIGVLWTADHQPKRNKREAILSPIVYCEPHGLQLKKGATLTLPHCAIDAKKWKITAWCSDTKTVALPDWKPHSSFKLSGSHVELKLNHFTGYTVTGDPTGPTAQKWIQLIAFAPTLSISDKMFPIRIYCLNDYTDKTARDTKIMESTSKNRKEKELLPPVNLAFCNSGENLCVDVDSISESWTISAFSEMKQELDFDEIWQAVGANCTIILETTERPPKVICNILGYQAGLNINKKKIVVGVERQKRVVDSRIDNESIQEIFPGSLCATLEKLLDPEKAGQTNNWLGLAEKFALSATEVHWLDDERRTVGKSPTRYLLNHWVTSGKRTLEQFLNIMKDLERYDVIDDISTWKMNNTNKVP